MNNTTETNGTINLNGTQYDCIYAWDRHGGQYVARIPGHAHGDGSIDSDESPVWLLATENEMTDAEIEAADANEVELND